MAIPTVGGSRSVWRAKATPRVGSVATILDDQTVRNVAAKLDKQTVRNVADSLDKQPKPSKRKRRGKKKIKFPKPTGEIRGVHPIDSGNVLGIDDDVFDFAKSLHQNFTTVPELFVIEPDRYAKSINATHIMPGFRLQIPLAVQPSKMIAKIMASAEAFVAVRNSFEETRLSHNWSEQRLTNILAGAMFAASAPVLNAFNQSRVWESTINFEWEYRMNFPVLLPHERLTAQCVGVVTAQCVVKESSATGATLLSKIIGKTTVNVSTGMLEKKPYATILEEERTPVGVETVITYAEADQIKQQLATKFRTTKISSVRAPITAQILGVDPDQLLWEAMTTESWHRVPRIGAPDALTGFLPLTILRSRQIFLAINWTHPFDVLNPRLDHVKTGIMNLAHK